MIPQIKEYVQQRNAYISELKRLSPLYPEVLLDDKEMEVYASTLVRICRGDKWYKVHVVQSKFISEETNIKHLVQKIHEECHYITNLYKLCGHEDLDEDQTPEEHRLVKLLLPH